MVRLWIMILIGVGIAGYLAYRIEGGLLDKLLVPSPTAELDNEKMEVEIEKTVDKVDKAREAEPDTPPIKPETPEETPAKDAAEQDAFPRGRVSGDASNRAALAARVVLPQLAPALHTLGLRAGDPIFIRIFKAELELELWIYHRVERRFRLFKTYRVEGMSGKPGPKLAEGDRQAPEGFYFVNRRRMNPNSNYHLSFDLGYPNAYDREHDRSGSYLMVHGSWVSAGCFAMTDYGIEEIYTLADAALSGGQRYFRVHIFPFRMTDAAMAKVQDGHQWSDFWQNLREGYDYFERGHLPPDVQTVATRYKFTKAAPIRID